MKSYREPALNPRLEVAIHELVAALREELRQPRVVGLRPERLQARVGQPLRELP